MLKGSWNTWSYTSAKIDRCYTSLTRANDCPIQFFDKMSCMQYHNHYNEVSKSEIEDHLKTKWVMLNKQDTHQTIMKTSVNKLVCLHNKINETKQHRTNEVNEGIAREVPQICNQLECHHTIVTISMAPCKRIKRCEYEWKNRTYSYM